MSSIGIGEKVRTSQKDEFVQSIRRESFIQTFGIKEDEEDSRNSSSDEKYKVDSSFRTRSSLTIDDIDPDITYKTGHGTDDMDVSLLDGCSNNNNVEIDKPVFASKRDPFGSLVTPPIFAGGDQRRKGDKQRRMRLRCGVRDSASDNRRTSTGTIGTSFQESFGEVSLQSFSSINSFSSTAASSQNKMLEVGNLVFVSDAEMELLMYGDGNDSAREKEGIMNSSRDVSAFAAKKENSMSSQLSASLPPSATLGTGAFSTVRLAWRKTLEHNTYDDSDMIDPSTSYQNMDEDDPKGEHRHSFVRVKSKASGDTIDPYKGELVAVKIIQKSILKQIKTIQKGPNNRLTVHTAFDNIEREIATMKQLKHPNLVRLFEVIDSIESDRLYMVLEYVSLGEILSHVEGTNRYSRMRYRKKVRGLTAEGHFDEKHAALYFVDIMHGLAFLHRNRICHRDLKPENIL
mmetsp:Transcript_12372/g.30239  ORF Transcript_12372/g.30239 Transcript_12372/m.30239 type:complete len:459 (+) Transcript_12372:351-1727(+)